MYDIVVIGAGPAGYVCAIRASKSGAKVAIVERAQLGGTCLNRGCIPTKDFLKNVEIIKSIKKAKSRGILLSSEELEIDIQKIVAHKNKTVKILTGGIGMLLEANGIEVFRAQAKLLQNNEILLEEEGRQKRIYAKKVVLATGSSVRTLPIEGIDNEFVYTSDTILEIDRIPKEMVIVGGGVIGCEFSQIFAHFGSKVHVVELENRILPMASEELSTALMKALKKDGVNFTFEKSVSQIKECEEGAQVVLNDGTVLTSDCVLISVGRKSNLEVVSQTEIELENGFIKTDEYLRTSLPNVFAIGDVNGRKMLAHAAFKMGEIAAHNALQEENMIRCDLANTPSVVYTIPEVAFIGERGASEAQNTNVGRFSFLANGRALASDEKVGFIHVFTDPNSGLVSGADMIGPNVSELINEVSVIMQNKLGAEDVLNSIHAHPSFSEVLYEAVADSIAMAIHK
ncbi:MAG: dihydrolipoyl dehydrogenase [Bacillota bacterium]|nr:dihydrolipoyl dehydrogenase [Bacillota bacterium]